MKRGGGERQGKEKGRKERKKIISVTQKLKFDRWK